MYTLQPSKATRWLLAFFLLLSVFTVKTNAQTYTITGNVNSSTLTCSTFTGMTTVYIGDGVIDSKLIMNSNLNLTNCGLAPIQLVIRNKGILEFSAGNFNLNLPAGSSVVLESGGNITTIGSCSNSDLILIGGNSVGSCNGAGSLPSFDEVVENGGINEAGILSGNQYICLIGGTTTFTSSESLGSFASGTPSVATVNATGVITAVAVGQSVITYTKGTKSTTRIVYVGSSFGGTVSGGTTVCSTTNSTILTLSGYKGTILRWESSTNNFSTSATISNTTNTLTVTNLPNTTSYRAVIGGTGCNSDSTSATIIVGTNLSAMVIIAASPSGTICAGTSITFTATPTNGGTTPTYQWKLNGVNVGTNATTYTNSTLVNNDLVTCVMTSSLACATGSPTSSSPIIMVVNTTNTWTGATSTSWFTPSNWSCGSVPTASSDVTIPNVTNKPIIDDVTKIALANTLTVDTSSSLVVESGNNLQLIGKLTNNGGTISFEDSASLVQTTFTGDNTGNITYKRYATIRNTDYTYWSSPVKNYTLGGVSQNKTLSDKYYSYNSTIDNWQQESAATGMTPGIGYIIRGPEPTTTPPLPPPPSPYEASFVGVPNNGNVPVSVTYTNSSGLDATDPNFGVSYLLGNPYPSAIDAETFLDNNNSVLGGTIYFWTHNTALDLAGNITNPGPGWAYTYSLDDYAVYNAVGGVGVGSGTASPSGSTKPNGYIAAGQGFFATGIATGTVNFTNAIRLAGTTKSDGTGTNQQFFKTKNPSTKPSKAIEKNRIWLNLSNTQGAFKQSLIGYLTDATNEYDSRFDGESFDGNEYVDFYSINQDKNLTIQGRALPFDENDEVPLGYRTTINGAFTITIDQTDGVLTNQAVYIEDKLTKTVTNLKSGNYTFNTVAGTFNDRFVLRYKDISAAKTLATANFDTQANKVLISIKNKQFKINSFAETIGKVSIYDLAGRQIYQKDKVNSNELSISNLVSSHQVLIVKTSLQNGKTVTDKVIY